MLLPCLPCYHCPCYGQCERGGIWVALNTFALRSFVSFVARVVTVSGGIRALNRHDPQRHRASIGDKCNDRNRKGVCFTPRFHMGVFMSMFLPNMKVKMICIS